MAQVKVVKSSPYYSRFQVKFKRRRKGKTDYQARRRLCQQDKNKYNTPKYRLVARFTNKKVVAQINWATLTGDKVLCSVQSSELKRYGLTVGLTNYSASQCTGLLLARRLLQKLKLDKHQTGKEDVDGEIQDVEASDQIGEEGERTKRPFKAILDVGLKRTTTGSKVFGVLKGVADGGIHVPHSSRRFPGYTKTQKEETFDATTHRNHIFGNHVQAQMDLLKEENKTLYTKQFSKWDAMLKKSKHKNLESLYASVHEAIRKDPKAEEKKAKKKFEHVRKDNKITSGGKTYIRDKRLTREARQERVDQKIQAALAKKKR